MKTHKFARKPFYIDAVRVSEENLEEVAQWCNGTVVEADAEAEVERHVKVKVHRPLNKRQTEAFVGDWVLYAGTGFKVYNSKAFDKSFEKVKTLTKEQADAAGIKVPREPRRPANPVLEPEVAAQITRGDDPKPHFRTAKEKDPADELLDEVLKEA